MSAIPVTLRCSGLCTVHCASHRPQRGDDVEAWLKQWRDTYADPRDCPVPYRDPHARICFDAIDDLLDDYRLHAGTGTPLHIELDFG